MTSTASTEVGRDHQRPGEERVGRDRHHQQRLDLGPDDRPAGGEVVRRRAGRRGAHDAVAAPAGQRPAVDLDDDLEHPLARGLLDAGLVERPGGGDLLRALEDGHVEGQPLLDVVAALDDRGRWCGRCPRARPRRGSPTWPRLTPSSGVPESRASSAARRMVPSPPMTMTARAAAQASAPSGTACTTAGSGRSQGERVLLEHRHRDAVGAQRRAHLGRDLAGVGATGVDDAGRRAVGGARASSRAHPLITRRQRGPSRVSPLSPSRRGRRCRADRRSCPRRRDVGVGERRGPVRSQRKNSTLPDGPGSGLGATPAAPQPRAAAAPATAATASAAQRRVADHAARAEPLPADLELRLDHERRGRRPARVTPTSAASTSAQRDEGQVADDEVDRPADHARGSRSRTLVRSSDPHPVVGAQRPGQLAVADVDRDHLAPPRARSSTSVKPPVEAPASRQRRPVDARPRGAKASSAPASLCPPRET